MPGGGTGMEIAADEIIEIRDKCYFIASGSGVDDTSMQDLWSSIIMRGSKGHI